MSWNVLTISRGIRRYGSLAKLRNVGIIAHIDAGKTTTTERMLYYAGKINRMGDVDTGDTMTDFLPQERARGITIQSVAISFNWNNKGRINLIDTPGHADFSFEVIRSLKVLDGCVTILDAVSGVEAQTEKVWKIAIDIPKICFINKMDRVGAGYSRTVKEIITRLHTRPAFINIPVFDNSPTGEEPVFSGVIDVINKKIIRWDQQDPNKVLVDEIDPTKDKSLHEQYLHSRESLVDNLTEFDESLVEHYLGDAEGDISKISPKVLNESIRRTTIDCKITPVLCGSSFKHIGVQPLLDAICDYLPSPLEAKLPTLNHKNIPMKYDPNQGLIINDKKNICMALAFKVIKDPVRGIMVFIRVYAGTLRNGNTVYNTTQGIKFKIGKLVRMKAEEHEEIDHLFAGEIGVLTGSTIVNNISTGDTIISHSLKKDGIRSFDKRKELTLQIYPIQIPPPVFSVIIEPKSLGNKEHVESCLERLIIEDPSLHLSKDPETGQTILSGMGELHLDIAEDKLVNSMNAEVEFGKLSVAYKETLTCGTPENCYEDTDGYKFTVTIKPLEKIPTEISTTIPTTLDNETWIPLKNDNNFIILENNLKYNPIDPSWKPILSYDTIVNSIKSSALATLQKGGKLANYPLFLCSIRIKDDWEIPIEAEKPTRILEIIRNLIDKSLKQFDRTNFVLLEPTMNLDVTVSARDMGKISQDLTGSKNATILSIEDATRINQNISNDLEFENIAQKQYLPPDPTLTMANLGHSNSDIKIIKAEVPLKEMISYNKTLRSLTQGRGDFHMEYQGMNRVNKEREEQILQF